MRGKYISKHKEFKVDIQGGRKREMERQRREDGVEWKRENRERGKKRGKMMTALT